jgi:hypothetical protein
MRIRENLPDGILVRDSSNRSLKRELVAAAVYNPVTVGLLAVIVVQSRMHAAPAYSAPGAMPPLPPGTTDRLIEGNLHALWIASIRFYQSHHTTTARYDDLVGPGKFIPRLKSWIGENYRYLRFEKGRALRLILPDGRVLSYPPRPVGPPSTPKLEPMPAPRANVPL